MHHEDNPSDTTRTLDKHTDNVHIGGLQADLKGWSGGVEPPRENIVFFVIFGTKSDRQVGTSTLCQAPGTRYQESGTLHQVPGTRYLVLPGTRYLAPGILDPVPGTSYVTGPWYQVPGTRLVPGTLCHMWTCLLVGQEDMPSCSTRGHVFMSSCQQEMSKGFLNNTHKQHKWALTTFHT